MTRIAKHVPARGRTNRQDSRALPSHPLPRSAFYRAKATQVVPLPSPQADRNELAKRLRHFRVFERIPLAVLKVVAAGAHLRAFRQSEFIWRRGDSAREMVLIGSGFVKASRRDRNEASKTYGLFGPGDSIGLYAFWAGMRYPTDAVALSEGVTLIIFDAAEISRFAEQHPQLAKNMKGEVTRFSEAFINKIEIISAGSVQQRLAVLLLQLVGRYGVDGRDEQALLPVFLTLTQISEIINARIETVARALGHWKRAGWLTVDAHGWHFNCLDKLRQLLHG
jgi:CRP/FNR family transcriptional regulator